MELKELFNKYGIDLTETQEKQFNDYYNLLIEENGKYNLTAITEKNDVFIKHFLDSVLPYNHFKDNTTILDIGAGAGFPSIPLAILKPNINFTLIDSVNKKVNFINMAKNLLNLNNIIAIHTRCEDFAKQNCENFDYVVARAVANMNTLLEYMTPFAKINGEIVLYKGDNYLQEVEDSKNVLKMFHVKQLDVYHYDIENGIAIRNILIYQKMEKTNPKYPRSGNKPRLDPLK